MTIAKLRIEISRFVFFSNIVIYFLVILFYALYGFDEDEFFTLLSLLTPITAIYFGNMVKFIVENRFQRKDVERDIEVNPSYVTLTRVVTYAHFGILFLAISANALFNAINYDMLKAVFTLTEGLFGVYSGLISSSLFKNEPEEEVNEA